MGITLPWLKAFGRYAVMYRKVRRLQSVVVASSLPESYGRRVATSSSRSDLLIIAFAEIREEMRDLHHKGQAWKTIMKTIDSRNGRLCIPALF